MSSKSHGVCREISQNSLDICSAGRTGSRIESFSSIMRRLFISMLRKSRSLLSKEPGAKSSDEEWEAATVVPKDVEEGYFVVFAVDGNERKRFVINLEYLSNPAFLRLLELAEEEYGFNHEGALAVPCRPEELQKIVEGRRKQKDGEWITSNVHMIASY